ncbi:MAG TPA: hypothetical protein VK399_19055 [Longimicrobiaceae bacterium]|nr:hypothetical protein [Longimicrobiaceae bacterium]
MDIGFSDMESLAARELGSGDSTRLRTMGQFADSIVVSCVTEPQPDPGAAGGTPEPGRSTRFDRIR